MTDTVQLVLRGPRATITLNDPAKHNRLDPAGLSALRAAIEKADADPDVRVTVITGAGEKTFCSGYDLGSISASERRSQTSSDDSFEKVMDRLEAMRMPTLCALNGGVYGGATDLALACDFRLGVRGMKFFMPAARFGLHYYPGGLRRYTQKVSPSFAKRAFLLSEDFADTELLAVGYLDWLVERAYQQAAAFARNRVQSKDDGSPKPESVAIVHHADVRRMLMTMRAQIEAMRALGYYTAAGIDGALKHPDKEAARKTQDRVDLLIPIVKAWFTDLGNEIASTGVQIHGGMGFIEETGAAQHLRDARILPIYEGTNGIQARDLVGRKVAKDGGETMLALVAEMRALADEMKAAPGDDLAAVRAGVVASADALEDATKWVAQSVKAELVAALAGSVPFLRLAGTALGGWLLARGALVAQTRLATRDGDPAFLEAKLITARFYAEVILPPALAQLGPLKAAGRTVFALREDQF